ncbi:MAG: hypothetical protein ACE5FN_07415 [Leptospirillia bacterium]
MDRIQGVSYWRLPIVSVAAALVAVLFALQLEGGAREIESDRALYVEPILSASQLAGLGGGFAPALADIYWIRIVGTPQEVLNDPRGILHVYQLLDRASRLDPIYQMPYHYGGILLSIQGHRPDLANRLLERAERIFPGDWRYPFYHGFNNLYHAIDFADATRAMRRAADLPGSPPYLQRLAGHLEQGGRDPRMMLELIDRMLTVIQDPAVRARIQQRRQAFVAQIEGGAG